eukprot:TRINITY_DN10200_c0_g1_i1.p1 TRINITY_DN10200_c0_g1~~TRINITY_DN10200_c0_g1_i1.p1  ORF type:complete len:264 (+),score=43.88 TRINITY_DN10200_c0_g1_i1:69-860(+)
MTTIGAYPNHDLSSVLVRRMHELERKMTDQIEQQNTFERRVYSLVIDVVQTISIAMQKQEEKTQMLEGSLEKLSVDRDSQKGQPEAKYSSWSLETGSNTELNTQQDISATIASRLNMMSDSSDIINLKRTEEVLAQLRSEFTASGAAPSSEIVRIKAVSEYPLGSVQEGFQASSGSPQAGACQAGAVPPGVFSTSMARSASSPPSACTGTVRKWASFTPQSTPHVLQVPSVSSACYPGSGKTPEAASFTPHLMPKVVRRAVFL